MPSPYRLAGARAITADLIAIVIFATIGLLAHGKDIGVSGYSRDVLTIGGSWLVVARSTGLYRSPTLRRYLTTWIVGVTAGVAVRAIVLGRAINGKELSFLIVALISTLIFTSVVRSVVDVATSRRVPA